LPPRGRRGCGDHDGAGEFDPVVDLDGGAMKEPERRRTGDPAPDYSIFLFEILYGFCSI
jgi:hypothetical protein